MAPTRSSTHGSSALSTMFKTGSLHGHHHNDDRPSSSNSSAATGPLPKHPTNKKPYPHSPSGSLPSLHGDTIQLTYDSVDIERAAKEVQSKWAGATVCFLGSTREDWAHPDTAASASSSAPPTLRVTRLEYECYTPLALKTMRAILQRARETPSAAWPPADLSSREIAKIDEAVEAELTAKDMAAGETGATTSGNAISRAGTSSSSSKKDSRRGSAQQAPPSSPQDAVLRIHLSHRLGPVPVGQPSILLAVSSPHRRRAFEVAEWILEEVKRIVPVWKREVREAVDDESGGKKKGSGKKGGDGRHDEEGTSEWVGLDNKAALAGPAAASNGNATTTNNGAAEASDGATDATAGEAGQNSNTLGGGDDLSKVTTKDEVFQDAALAPSMSRAE